MCFIESYRDSVRRNGEMARILVIDDEPEMRTILRQILEGAGYEVVDASNSREGLSRYSEKPADLVITGLVMPEKEGIETILDLKRRFAGVKIIAISGGGHVGPDDYLSIASGLGAQKTFAKPFNIGELLKAIRELLVSVF
jgi:DNA-binding response OmpR family regulator